MFALVTDVLPHHHITVRQPENFARNVASEAISGCQYLRSGLPEPMTAGSITSSVCSRVSTPTAVVLLSGRPLTQQARSQDWVLSLETGSQLGAIRSGS